MNSDKIYLSPPNIDSYDFISLESSLRSGWVAPVGPQIDEFEGKLERSFEGKRVLALNSGTSALHMALILAGITKEDHVVVGSMTFAACANVVLYQNAIPVFLDSEEETWNLDPAVLRDYLKNAAVKPKAIIVTHLFGIPAKMDQIKSIAEEYEICLIEDAAEALGTLYKGQMVGQLGDYGILSFNGNKIITTGGGGALICSEEDYKQGLLLASQANSGTTEYDHKLVGYNYRLSNVLAGLGIGQLDKLDQFLDKKKSIRAMYASALGEYLDFPEHTPDVVSNNWLSVGLLRSGNPLDLFDHLRSQHIELRRVWKPLHMHSAYEKFEFVGDGICEGIFEKGICLPSGSGMSEEDQERVIKSVIAFFCQ